MLTQCPNCQTTFRVTSEILRVAHGQVRCGRCHTQFDALERLIEEGDEAESGSFLQPSRNRAQPTSTIEVDEPDAQEDITLEGHHIEITGTYRALDDLDGDGEPRVHQEVTEEWVEIDDVDADMAEVEVDAADGLVVEEAEAQDETSDEAIEAEAAQAGFEQEFAPEPAYAAQARRISPAIVASRRWTREVRSVEYADDDYDVGILPSGARGLRTVRIWKILAVPLILLLLAQIVHHNRAALARNPSTGDMLMSIYSALHVPLTPDWNLHAYYIKQWGVLSDPGAPGTLKVRASITNRAQFAQPYPLLKLVLEDRWGDQVRAREFEPAEYLDPGTSTGRLLAPQQQVNATVAIVDPGPDAEGFRFDVCLRGRAGPVCAAEVPE